MHEQFIAAIHARRRVRLTFRAEGDVLPRTRSCAPMDFGPGRKVKDPTPRYWFWDFDSPDRSHTLGLLPGQIISIDSTTDAFDPAEFVTWPPNWFIPRDWGEHS